MTFEDKVLQIAKAMAYSIRQPNDLSKDAGDYWDHTGESARHSWRTVAVVAVRIMEEDNYGPL